MSVLQKVTWNSEFFRYELVTYTHRTERVHWKNNIDVKRAGPDVCEEEKEETWDSGFIRFSWEGSGGKNFMVWLQSWSFHTHLSMSVGLFEHCWDSIWRHRNHFTELTDLERHTAVSLAKYYYFTTSIFSTGARFEIWVPNAVTWLVRCVHAVTITRTTSWSV